MLVRNITAKQLQLWDHATKFARWQHPAVEREMRFTVFATACFYAVLGVVLQMSTRLYLCGVIPEVK